MQDDLRPASAGRAGNGNGRPRILLAGGGLALGEDAGRMLVERYEVEVIDEAQAALAEIQRRPPDLVILDGDASRRSSPGLLHLLRSDQECATIPVIVLVDQPEEGSAIEGLDARADDFLVRPVAPGELIARVRALLARVSLLRQAEEALRHREQRFAHFMDNLPGLAWIKDSQGRYVYANDAAVAAFRTRRDQLYGRSDGEIFPPETAAQFRENDRRARAEPAGIRTIETLEHEDGLVHHSIVSKFPIPGAGDVSDLIGGIAFDITDLKRTEEALRQSQQQLMLLVEAAGSLSASLEMDAVAGAILALSRRLVAADAYAVWRHQAAADRWGIVLASGLSEEYQRSAIPMLDPTPRLPEVPVIAEDISQVPLLGHRRDAYEYEGIRSMLVLPLTVRGARSGTLVFYYRTRHHFTEVEVGIASALANLAAAAIGSAELYDEVRAHDRRKDEFLAMLAHELRNPLAAISSAVALIGFEGPLSESIAFSMDIIGRQTRNLVRLIDDLLDVSRITLGKIQLRKTEADAGSVLKGAVASVRPFLEELHHQLILALDPGLWLEADPTRLEQIVVNLLTNAAKYTEGPGRIWLSARREQAEIVIRVRDTGIGIAPEQLPRMFELFVQGDRSPARAPGGLGIGLTLVQKLAEMHGGSVQARSEGRGHGSEFIVRLPAAAHPARQSRSENQDYPHEP
jgi:PAS domain S-box-containing protein